jgi:hypothetical protein
MKMTYILIGSILTVGIIFFFNSCKNKSTSNEDLSKPKKIKTEENTFPSLRKMAFSVTPEKLGLSLPNDQTRVYGVIMDWEMGGATATTVSYITGDASLYLSSGGGVIGGGQHQNVNNAAKEFVKLSESYLSKTDKIEEPNLPNENEVIFYLLTNKGLYKATEKMENFENHSSDWISLFEGGNKVLTELRMVSDK